MSSSGRSTNGMGETESSSRRGENLPLAYQGLLTGIARIQAGRQHVTDVETFRKRTKAALEEVQRDAVKAGFESSELSETHFAVVALLDSVILNSSETIRAEWERRTLQEELFGQTDAGVVFFEKLERLLTRGASQHLADVLEIYLLCLLLGFEGRYCGGRHSELDNITERLRSRMRDLRTGAHRLSPMGLPPESTIPTARALQRGLPYRLIALGAIIFTLLLFVVAKFNLLWTSDQVGGRFG